MKHLVNREVPWSFPTSIGEQLLASFMSWFLYDQGCCARSERASPRRGRCFQQGLAVRCWYGG